MKSFAELTDQGKARRLRQTALKALSSYDVAPQRLTQLTIHNNYMFRVQDGGGRSFALRILRQQEDGIDFHDPVDTRLECWWVQKLAADGLPVAAVIANADGDMITTVDGVPGVPGKQRCVLFEWLPGSEPDEDQPWFWTELGRRAAELHQHSAGLTLPRWAEPRRWDSVFPYEDGNLRQSAEDGLLTPGQSETLNRAIEILNPYLAGLYLDRSRPPQLVHGDLHDENTRSYRRRLSVFDFEDLLEGYPEHDLAVALYGPYYNRSDVDDVVVAMRSGYEEVAPWPVADLEQLRPLFAARAVGLVNFCLALGAGYLDYVGMLVDRVADIVERPPANR